MVKPNLEQDNHSKSRPWCRSRLCVVSCSQVATNDRGFCCGILERAYAHTPKEDIVKFCFVDKNGKVTGYCMTPSEALLAASALAWTYENWVKKENGERTW